MSGAELLLDTNVVIGFLAGHERACDLVAASSASAGTFAISQITRMELMAYPRLTDQEAETIGEFLRVVDVILLDENIEAAAVALRKRLGLKLPDAIIVGTAKTMGLKLLTPG